MKKCVQVVPKTAKIDQTLPPQPVKKASVPVGKKVRAEADPPKVTMTQLRSRFVKIVEREAELAGKETPGPSSMLHLTKDDRAREAFFTWAFQQNPDMLVLLSRFLSHGFRNNEALSSVCELIREASKMLKFSDPSNITPEKIKQMSRKRSALPWERDE
jgi:hypothetical protein